jgi:phosphate transport system protein
MERHFDDELNQFNEQLLKMAVLVEQAIDRSITALKKQDRGLAQSVIEDDKAIDEMENENEEKGIDLLACFEPKAIDLRFITMGINISSELERIADMAVNISYKVIDIVDHPLLNPLVDIPRLSDIARQMVKDAIDAFVRRDEDLAKGVIRSEPKSDELRNAIVKELIYDYIVKDGACAPRAIPLLLIARDLERISDHAMAIAEDVIYMVRAIMVKHHPEKLSNNDYAI